MTPIRRTRLGNTRAPALERLDNREAGSMKLLRIVVVDDDVLIGMLLCDMLASMGHVVCALELTEENAVDAALRLRPDLIIVDARLGDGSGVTAIEKILRGGYVPHVFVTGDIIGVRLRAPAAVVLQKPFGEAGLARAIQRALAARIAV